MGQICSLKTLSCNHSDRKSLGYTGSGVSASFARIEPQPNKNVQKASLNPKEEFIPWIFPVFFSLSSVERSTIHMFHSHSVVFINDTAGPPWMVAGLDGLLVASQLTIGERRGVWV